jgi:hypothetical protein
LGPVGSNGTLTQNLATTVGESYLISFAWAPDAGAPSDLSTTLSAAFGGTTLFSVTNPGASGFQSLSFVRTATTATTPLTFTFRDDPSFLLLDAVSVSLNAVTTVPEPATLSLLGLGLAARYLRRKRSI